jgi:hypothetical protein
MSEIPSNEKASVEVSSTPAEGLEWSIRRDPFGAIFWASALVLAGLVLLADNLGMLPRINDADAWDWIVLGGGGLLLLSELVRAVSGDYGRPSTGRIILGLALAAWGAVSIFGVASDILWPAALIILGAILLVRNIAGR